MDELRERLIGTGVSVRDVDVLLRAIEAARFVLVERDRWERVRDAADAAGEFADTTFLLSDAPIEQAAPTIRALGARVAEAALNLMPGDLDGDV